MSSSEGTVSTLDAFRFCRDEIKHEYNVLGARLTSYITSQSFLFTTYGVSMGNLNPQWGQTFRLIFPSVVCLVGLLTSFRAHPGIRSACLIIDALHKRQLAFYSDPEVQKLDPTESKWMIEVHSQSLMFSTAASFIFGVAWAVLLVLAVYLRFV